MNFSFVSYYQSFGKDINHLRGTRHLSTINKEYSVKPYPIQKAVFTKKGDTLNEYREIITSEKTKVELVWKDFHKTILVEIPVKPYTIITMLIPAKTAEVHINGIKSAGYVFPKPEGTAQGSTGALALSETWIK